MLVFGATRTCGDGRDRGKGSGKGEELKNLTYYMIRREIVHVEVQHPRAKINLILYGGNKEALEKYKNERNDV